MADVQALGRTLDLQNVAAIPEAAGLEVVPHGPAGPGANIAAHLGSRTARDLA